MILCESDVIVEETDLLSDSFALSASIPAPVFAGCCNALNFKGTSVIVVPITSKLGNLIQK